MEKNKGPRGEKAKIIKLRVILFQRGIVYLPLWKYKACGFVILIYIYIVSKFDS